MIATRSIDLNADLGELPGDDGARIDAAMIATVTSANVACGGHAGDEVSMKRVTADAAEHGVVIGAHVSYPDREGFGRRPFAGPLSALIDDLTQQLGALRSAAEAAGTTVSYIKAHGALYNAAVAGEPNAVASLVDLSRRFDLPLLTMAHGRLAQAATITSRPWFAEGFADRNYGPEGHLVPRTEAAAVVTEPDVVVERVVRMADEGRVRTSGGADIPVRADSICLHSDTDGAVQLASLVRAGLTRAGIRLESFLPTP